MARRRVSDAEILAQIPAARAREARARANGQRATSARYDRAAKRIVIELTNRFLIAFPVDAIPSLAGLSAAQLSTVEVDPSGAGLRWEALDVDLSVPGLLLSAVGAQERQSHLASLIGRVVSPAKAKAARANGAKGGRPRKKARPG